MTNFIIQYQTNQNLNELIFDLSDIFINVILLKNSTILKIFENEKDIDIYEFKDEEKILIQTIHSYLDDSNINGIIKKKKRKKKLIKKKKKK